MRFTAFELPRRPTTMVAALLDPRGLSAASPWSYSPPFSPRPRVPAPLAHLLQYETKRAFALVSLHPRVPARSISLGRPVASAQSPPASHRRPSRSLAPSPRTLAPSPRAVPIASTDTPRVVIHRIVVIGIENTANHGALSDRSIRRHHRRHHRLAHLVASRARTSSSSSSSSSSSDRSIDRTLGARASPDGLPRAAVSDGSTRGVVVAWFTYSSL